MNNRQVRELREAFRLLYSVIEDDRGQEELDRMRFELERKYRIELYLEDLFEDLDPPDNEDEIQPIDKELVEWLNRNDYTMYDWYAGAAAVREESEAVLGCKFDDRGRRRP